MTAVPVGPHTGEPMSTLHDDARQDVAFSAAIRAATGASHSSAEQSGAMKSLLEGTMTRDAYAVMLGQHLHAYRALDEGTERLRTDPVATPFLDDALSRVAAIEADLVVLGADVAAPSAATAAYCERIRETAATWPGGFVAHHYVRYLGDLSGGQYLRTVVKEAFGLTDTEGASYYVFADIPDAIAWKDAYRGHLDTAPWDAEERARIIDEVLSSYRLTTAVLDDLG